jgi:hypothetical protein
VKSMTKFLVTSAIAAAVFPAALIGCPGGSICDGVVCPANEVCSEITGTCVPDSGGEGEGDAGEGEGEGKACSDVTNTGGACLEEAPPQLCNGSNCEAPQGLTGGCDAGSSNAVTNEDIVIYDVVDAGGPEDGGNCGTAFTYVASVYSEETDLTTLTSFYSQNFKIIDDDGTVGLSYSNGPTTPFHAKAEALGANFPGEYLVTFSTCNAFAGAAMIASGGNSNAYCAQ